MSRINRRYFLSFKLQCNRVSVTQSGYYPLCGGTQYDLPAPLVRELERSLSKGDVILSENTKERLPFAARDRHFWDLGACVPQVTRSRWVLEAKRVDSGITDRLVNQRPMEARNSASTISAISGASKNCTI